ncbi:hypothetical protein [Eisenbergiella massiliensis]
MIATKMEDLPINEHYSKIQYDKGAGKRFCFPARSFDLACN